MTVNPSAARRMAGRRTACSGRVPYCVEHVRPARERSGHRDGRRADRIAPISGVARGRGPVAHRLIHVGARGLRRGAEIVDDDVAAVRQPDVRDAAAENADHHRLDHRQREQRRDGGIDRVAAAQQNLGRRGGRERMVGDDHAARADRRPLLANERRRAGSRGSEQKTCSATLTSLPATGATRVRHLDRCGRACNCGRMTCELWSCIVAKARN